MNGARCWVRIKASKHGIVGVGGGLHCGEMDVEGGEGCRKQTASRLPPRYSNEPYGFRQVYTFDDDMTACKPHGSNTLTHRRIFYQLPKPPIYLMVSNSAMYRSRTTYSLTPVVACQAPYPVQMKRACDTISSEYL
jgi:hypothetical protein